MKSLLTLSTKFLKFEIFVYEVSCLPLALSQLSYYNQYIKKWKSEILSMIASQVCDIFYFYVFFSVYFKIFFLYLLLWQCKFSNFHFLLRCDFVLLFSPSDFTLAKSFAYLDSSFLHPYIRSFVCFFVYLFPHSFIHFLVCSLLAT